jgi:hypothetical protein
MSTLVKKNPSFTRALSAESLHLFPISKKEPPSGVRVLEIVSPAHVSTPTKGKNAGKTIQVEERVTGLKTCFVDELPSEAAARIKNLPKEEQSAARREFNDSLAANAAQANAKAKGFLKFVVDSGLFTSTEATTKRGEVTFKAVALKQSTATQASLLETNAKLMAQVEAMRKQLEELTATKKEEELF